MYRLDTTSCREYDVSTKVRGLSTVHHKYVVQNICTYKYAYFEWLPFTF